MPLKLKALIVDDEYPARQELRFALKGFNNVEIVGEATNAQEALALIRALDYQVLFLDISMPGMSGLELGEVIQEMPRRPCIIFVTAYDEFAVNAFEVNAVDYILKPFEPSRLTRAIDKVVKAFQETAGGAESGVALGIGMDYTGLKTTSLLSQNRPHGQIKFDRIPAEKQGKTILVPESDIFYAFTEQEYVYFKTFSDKLITRFTLKDLETRLDPNIFFRTHRCYLVNLHKVKEIVPFFSGTYNLTLDDEERSEVPVSRAQAKKLRKILGL